MKTLQPHEIDLIRDWIVRGKNDEGDETCKL